MKKKKRKEKAFLLILCEMRFKKKRILKLYILFCSLHQTVSEREPYFCDGVIEVVSCASRNMSVQKYLQGSMQYRGPSVAQRP